MIHGIGINDMPRKWRLENELNERTYRCWQSMITRCYSEKYHEKHYTYKNCYVCERWLKLSNFVEDIVKIDNYNLWLDDNNYQLDKDIKNKDKDGCYCLENCIFITKTENIAQSNKTRDYKNDKNPNYNNHKLKGKNNPKSKKVGQYDLDGNLIKVWDYAKQISEEVGINYSLLRSNLQGKRKTYELSGFIWKYVCQKEGEEE